MSSPSRQNSSCARCLQGPSHESAWCPSLSSVWICRKKACMLSTYNRRLLIRPLPSTPNCPFGILPKFLCTTPHARFLFHMIFVLRTGLPLIDHRCVESNTHLYPPPTSQSDYHHSRHSCSGSCLDRLDFLIVLVRLNQFPTKVSDASRGPLCFPVGPGSRWSPPITA